MPLGVKSPGLKQSLKLIKKAGKGYTGPVGRRINVTQLLVANFNRGKYFH